MIILKSTVEPKKVKWGHLGFFSIQCGKIEGGPSGDIDNFPEKISQCKLKSKGGTLLV